MAIVFKPIQQKKFNDAVYLKAFTAAANKTGKDMEKDFKLTTKTWKHKPVFQREVSVGPKSVDILVGTDDPIYGYVDQGTRPHIIQPKKPGGKLAFRSQYTAKTVPNVIGSKAGGAKGSMVFRDWVLHPGTQARNFDKIIGKKWQSVFRGRMEQALHDANRKSGHAKS